VTGRAGGAIAGVVLLVASTGCESTAHKADRLRASRARLIAAKPLVITPNAAISTRVLAVLHSADATAVVLRLTSHDRRRSVVWAPISVRIVGPDGKQVAETNVAGADPLLVHVASLPAGGNAYYVNDQLDATPPGSRATVTLGGVLMPISPPPARLPVVAHLENDPTYGPSFAGSVTNTTAVVQQQVILQAIIERGGQVVAAGTAIVRKLAPRQRADFQGFFTGSPSAAGKLTVTAPASNSGGVGAPAP